MSAERQRAAQERERALEDDITAARIRHLGPCPYWRGHEVSPVALFMLGLVAGIFAGLWIMYLAMRTHG